MYQTSFVKCVSMSVVFCAFVAVSESVSAQATPTNETVSAPGRSWVLVRVYDSAVGSGVGGAIGALIGYQISYDRRPTDGDVFNATPYSALLGFVIGAGIGAASDVNNDCRFGKRFSRSLLGAGIGATAAFILSGALHNTASLMAAVPVGAVGGSVAALGRCRSLKL